MPNKKVYLAKHTLASGFDVEYVKSHLSRIPGIVLIESGMGVEPGECAAFVIVPDGHCKYETGPEISLSKNVYQELDDFLDNYEGDEEIGDIVYIYKEPKDTCGSGVEKTVPSSFYTSEGLDIGVSDLDNYDAYGYVTVEICDDGSDDESEWERDDCDLLSSINYDIGNSQGSYLNVPRHIVHKPEYAVPAVPSLEERKLKQSVFDVDKIDAQLARVAYAKTTESSMNLLLLRRRK